MSKPKDVKVDLIPRDHNGETPLAYRIMDELVAKHHPDLCQAKIALAWHYGWDEDPDGRLQLGQAKKASDLDRALHSFDLVILLNYHVWISVDFSAAQMEALIDHELCHFAVVKDEEGFPQMDSKHRECFRIRKHDVEEFCEIGARHGMWKADIEKFVGLAMEANKKPLLKAIRNMIPEDGSVTISAHGKSATLDGKARAKITAMLGEPTGEVKP